MGTINTNSMSLMRPAFVAKMQSKLGGDWDVEAKSTPKMHWPRPSRKRFRPGRMRSSKPLKTSPRAWTVVPPICSKPA